MRLFVAVLLMCVSCAPAVAQQSAPPSSPPAPIAASAEGHKSAVELVEAMGARQRMLDHVDDTVKAGKDAIARDFPGYDPAFAEEWGRRMKARVNVDDYVAVIVRVYETHFNNAELRELIQAQHDTSASKPPDLSPELRQKVIAESATIESEIIGGCSQVGAKLGGDVGRELAKEHPEWIKQTPPK